MPKFALATESAANRKNTSLTQERLINVFPVPAPSGSPSSMSFRSVPGLRLFSTVPTPFLRAMEHVQGDLYVISSGYLTKINSGGVTQQIGEVVDSPQADIRGHRDNVTFVSGADYGVYDGTAIEYPGSGRLGSEGSLAFLNQYTFITEKDGREVEWTDAGNPKTRNALNFATAEGQDDTIIRVRSFGSYLWVFKQRSTEIWYNTGSGVPASAFGRIPGGVINRGLKGYNLVTRTPEGIFFVGENNVPYRLNGTVPEPIAGAGIVRDIANYDLTHLFYYEFEGHQFLVLRFSDRPAWVFDNATKLWHERSTGTDHKPWEITHSAFAHGQWILGSETGELYTLRAEPTDNGRQMRRTIITPPLYQGGDPFTVAELEIKGRFGWYTMQEQAPDWLLDTNGFPILDDEGQYIEVPGDGEVEYRSRPVRMWTRTSNDGGHTWNDAVTHDIGILGRFEAKANMRALGQFEHFTMEINMTDAVDVPLWSDAEIKAN